MVNDHRLLAADIGTEVIKQCGYFFGAKFLGVEFLPLRPQPIQTGEVLRHLVYNFVQQQIFGTLPVRIAGIPVG